MRTALRLIALCLLLVTLALWFFGGMNPGRTQNVVAVSHRDAVTGQEHIVREHRFLPGWDFLLLASVLAGGLFGFSFFVPGREPAQAAADDESSGQSGAG